MKRDCHFKIEEELLQRLYKLAEDVGLPATRFIESAIREYIERQRGHERYTITGVNKITETRIPCTAQFKTLDAAQMSLDNIRKSKSFIMDYYKKLQIEKVTL